MQAEYRYGETATITAIPANGWKFLGWTGDFVSTDNPADVPVIGDLEITATFAEHNVDVPGNCPGGTVSYWPLDETTGTVFADSAGLHHANCSATCPTPTTGTVGGAALLSGAEEVRAPADPQFDFAPGASFSLEAWVQTTDTGNGTYIGRVDAGNGLELWLGQVAGLPDVLPARRRGGRSTSSLRR